jgi:hypothetical protein
MGWSTRRAGTVVVAALGAVAALVAVLATAPAAFAVSSDNGASFAVRCDFSHRKSDDPIVRPGEQGAAHSHDFFGNTTTNANSTYQTMTTGTDPHDPPPAPPPITTCTREEDKAGYWMPTLNWDGVERTSNRAVFYYRAGGKDHKSVKPFPKDLRVIADDAGHISWRCGRADNGKGTRNPPSQCSGGELGLRVIFPDCVDVDRNGKPVLDSDDHRSHMAYSRMRDGKVRCPRSHPRSVPVLTMNVTFPIPTTSGRVTLACDETSPCGASTMHADFWNTWNQAGLEHLVKRCINNVPPSRPRPEECRA